MDSLFTEFHGALKLDTQEIPFTSYKTAPTNTLSPVPIFGAFPLEILTKIVAQTKIGDLDDHVLCKQLFPRGLVHQLHIDRKTA